MVMNLLHVRETRAKEIISKMINRKIITKIGNGKNTSYCIDSTYPYETMH